VTANRAQFMADPSSLPTGTEADVRPEIQQMQQQGEAGLLPLWQKVTALVQAQTYSNAFFIAGCDPRRRSRW